jgi:general secretion pathway protein F/type IV pilus assembly protein PilC
LLDAMTEFAYVARDSTGQRVMGTVTAGNRREAVSAIAAKSLFPVEVKGAESVQSGKRLRRIPAQTLAVAFGQLADLLRSGVPLLRSLDVMRQQFKKPAIKEVLAEVHHEVEQGASLADAMGKYPHVFGEMAVNMVRAGSEGGFLEDALSRVAEFTETQDDLKKRTVGAMVYPAVLATVGTIIVVVLLVFFVPMFAGLFEDLREKGLMPAVTEMVLSFSGFVRSWYSLVIGLAVILGVMVFRRWASTDAGRLWVDRVRLKIPMAGKIYVDLAVARFCRVLGTLLHNGVPILRSLEISSGSTGNRVLAGAIQQATEGISSGQRLAGPLGACGHFPQAVVEMISVAEESNTLETVLVQIAASLERRTWRQLDLFVKLLEPLMLLVLAGVVLVMVIALLMPIMRMSQVLN